MYTKNLLTQEVFCVTVVVFFYVDVGKSTPAVYRGVEVQKKRSEQRR